MTEAFRETDVAIALMKEALVTGRRIKCLTCMDDFTKKFLAVTAAFGSSGV